MKRVNCLKVTKISQKIFFDFGVSHMPEAEHETEVVFGILECVSSNLTSTVVHNLWFYFKSLTMLTIGQTLSRSGEGCEIWPFWQELTLQSFIVLYEPSKIRLTFALRKFANLYLSFGENNIASYIE